MVNKLTKKRKAAIKIYIQKKTGITQGPSDEVIEACYNALKMQPEALWDEMAHWKYVWRAETKKWVPNQRRD
jgi:hypothetical protein